MRPMQVWKMSKFVGEAEHSLRAEVILVSTTTERKPWVRPPISMQFLVSGLVMSRGQVRRAYW